MGRFYTTAKPTFVDDIIYQAPHEIMYKALQSQQGNLDKQREVIDGFSTAGENLSYIDKDEVERSQLVDKHRQKAGDLAEKIAKNPALYQYYTAEINKAKRDYEHDMTSGKLFEMDRESKKRDKVRADEKTRLDKGDIDADQYEAAMETLDREYQGVGNGHYADNIHIYEKVDESTLVKDLKLQINENSSDTSTTLPDGGGYMIKRGNAVSYIKPERLDAIIESDPKMAKWRAGKLQTMERQLANGSLKDEQTGEPITDEQGMYNEYLKRAEAFKKSTIDKLAFEKVDTSTEYKSDATKLAKDRLAFDWTKWNKDQEDKVDNSYELSMKGTYKELDNASIEAAWAGMPQTFTTGAVGPLLPGQDSLTSTRIYTPEQKRTLLETEKKSLNKILEGANIDNQSFLARMKTSKGRAELAVELGLTPQLLARQANYNKDFSYDHIKAPEEKGQNYKLNQKYKATVVQGVNALPLETPVSYKVISPDGKVVETKTTTLGGALGDKKITGQRVATDVEDLIPMTDPNGQGVGYESPQGTIIRMPDPGGAMDPDNEELPLMVVATKEYVTENKLGKSKKASKMVLDPSKPLLNISGSELSQSEDVYYGDGASEVRIKKLYNVHTSIMSDNGKLQSVIVQIPADQLPIEMLQKVTKNK